MSEMEHQTRHFPEQAENPSPPVPHPEMRKTDSDRDGLTDRAEAEVGTDWLNIDSDVDGVQDGLERAVGIDPLDPDNDRQAGRGTGAPPIDPIGANPPDEVFEMASLPGQPFGPAPAAGQPFGPADPAAPGMTAATVGGSLLGARLLPPQQARRGTTLQRQFDDGSLQTITVGNDGAVDGTTTRHNPSTGAEVVDTWMPDGSRIHREDLPGGGSIEVTTYPDGTSEKTQFFHNSDGSVTTNHTDRQGWGTSTRQGQDPDGTLWEEKLLPPDNRTERRTSKETVQPDKSVLRETTGPDGTGREVTTADGRRSESVFTFPDGRQEASRMVTNEDGSTLTTFNHADGRWETLRKETLPNGTLRETLTRDKGGTEITLTSTIENADGSTTIDIDGPDSTHRTTTWPDGATETTVTYSDGTSERTASGFHPDGSKWHFTENRDGTWERIEQPVAATGALISRSDGTVIEQSFGDRIEISILRPDGGREKTDLDLDGAGTTQATDASGKVVSETVHEGTPIEPYPDLGDRDIPILSDFDLWDLDDRGVVGRVGTGGAAADPAADVLGDVVIPEHPTPGFVQEATPSATSQATPEPEVTPVWEEAPGLTDREPVLVSAPEPVARPPWDEPAFADEPETAPDRSFDDTSDIDS